MMTTSGWSAATRTMASSGAAAKPATVTPAGASSAARPSRNNTESSTTITRKGSMPRPISFPLTRRPVAQRTGAHLPADGMHPVPDGGQPPGHGIAVAELPSLVTTADSRPSAAVTVTVASLARSARPARRTARAPSGTSRSRSPAPAARRDRTSASSGPSRRATPARPPGPRIRAPAGTSPGRARAACRWRPGAAAAASMAATASGRVAFCLASARLAASACRCCCAPSCRFRARCLRSASAVWTIWVRDSRPAAGDRGAWPAGGRSPGRPAGLERRPHPVGVDVAGADDQHGELAIRAGQRVRDRRPARRQRRKP